MLPDTGERYLSTPLFADVPIDMTAEEIELSRSTPGARFDAPTATAPGPGEPSAPPALDPAAVAFVNEVIADATRPVVMFALEWCEFCWSLRRAFAHYRIEYRAIDLDSVEYQPGNRGGAIRAALTARTGVATIPQVFVGGEFVGGCTDVLDRLADGRLQSLLSRNAVAFRRDPSVEPHSFLPGWLQPRRSA
jgi:cysteine synthase A